MEDLADEYREWLEANYLTGLNLDAEEMLLVDATVGLGQSLTDEQRFWLRSFIGRWDRQQKILDRIQGLMVEA
jgi:hypothetical protein